MVANTPPPTKDLFIKRDLPITRQTSEVQSRIRQMLDELGVDKQVTSYMFKAKYMIDDVLSISSQAMSRGGENILDGLSEVPVDGAIHEILANYGIAGELNGPSVYIYDAYGRNASETQAKTQAIWHGTRTMYARPYDMLKENVPWIGHGARETADKYRAIVRDDAVLTDRDVININAIHEASEGALYEWEVPAIDDMLMTDFDMAKKVAGPNKYKRQPSQLLKDSITNMQNVYGVKGNKWVQLLGTRNEWKIVEDVKELTGDDAPVGKVGDLAGEELAKFGIAGLWSPGVSARKTGEGNPDDFSYQMLNPEQMRLRNRLIFGEFIRREAARPIDSMGDSDPLEYQRFFVQISNVLPDESAGYGPLDAAPKRTTMQKHKKNAKRLWNLYTKQNRGLPEDIKKSLNEIRAADKEVSLESILLGSRLKQAFEKAYGYDYKHAKNDTEKVDMVREFLDGNLPPNVLDDELVGAVSSMRVVMDELSKMIMASIKVDMKIINDKLMLTEDNRIRADLKNQYKAKMGLFSTIGRGLGRYMNRAYRAHAEKNWVDYVKNNHRSWIQEAAAEMADIYVEEVDPDANLQEVYQSIGDEIDIMLVNASEHANFAGQYASGKLGSRSMGIFKKRKDLPPKLRRVLGEFTDPIEAFELTVKKQNDYIHNAMFMQNLYKNYRNSGFLHAREKDIPSGERENYTQISELNNKAYEPLSGWWIPTEWANAIDSLHGLSSDWNGFKKWVLRPVAHTKLFATVWNLQTQARNFLNNYFYIGMNGHWLNPASARDREIIGIASAGAKAFIMKQASDVKLDLNDSFEGREGKPNNIDDFLLMTTRLGITGNSVHGGQVKGYRDDAALDDTINIIRGEGDSLTRRGAGYLSKWIISVNELAQSAYSFGDDFWKITYFLKEMDAVTNPKRKQKYIDAGKFDDRQSLYKFLADEIRNRMPAYDEIPLAVQTVGRLPFAGDFPAFTSESIRNSWNTIKGVREDIDIGVRDRAMGRLGSFLGVHAIIPATSVWAGTSLVQWLFFDEDGEENKNEEFGMTLAEAARHQAPWYQKHNALVPVWGDKKTGEVTVLDLGHFSPFGPLSASTFIAAKDMLNRASERDFRWKDAADIVAQPLSAFTSESMAFGMLTNLWRGKDPYGKVIWDEHNTIEENVKGVFQELRSLEPRILSSADRLFKSFLGEKRGGLYPREYNAMEEFVALGGPRATRVDSKVAMYFHAMTFSRDSRGFKSKLNRAVTENLNSFESPDEVDITEVYEREQLKYKKLQDDLKLSVRAAMRMGLSKTDIIRQFTKSGMGVALANRLTRDGAYDYLKPSWSVVEAHNAEKGADQRRANNNRARQAMQLSMGWDISN